MSFRVVETKLDRGRVAKGLVEDAEASTPRQNPIVVDFESPKLQHRLKNNADGEAIVKAIGTKRSARSGLVVYDFTAGLGTEAFLLARAGFTVIAFERDGKVFELLEDGLQRYRESELARGVEIESCLKLEFRWGEAVEQIEAGLRAGTLVRAHAVSLDPMFEGESTETKSLPKKEMALLRKMLPPSNDAGLRRMMTAAFSIADSRVIVKRPNGSIDLAADDANGRPLRPAHRLEGKTARFDIYSCR
ncbi:class I SAM-dependent methyltransferase [soil metagenome]